MKFDPILKFAVVIMVLFMFGIGLLFLTNMISSETVKDVSIKFTLAVVGLVIGSLAIKFVVLKKPQ